MTAKTGYFIVLISDDARRRAIDILPLAGTGSAFVVAQIADVTTLADRHSRRVL